MSWTIRMSDRLREQLMEIKSYWLKQHINPTNSEILELLCEGELERINGLEEKREGGLEGGAEEV